MTPFDKQIVPELKSVRDKRLNLIEASQTAPSTACAERGRTCSASDD